jgi:hypothetical protein
MTATLDTRISPRIARPERHYGGGLGVTKWEYSRIVYGRITLFEIIHDGVTNTTTVRTYPGAGWTAPTHDFTIRGLTVRDVAARLA